MIILLFLNLVVSMLNAAFFWLPTVTVLPTIGSINLDTAFSTFSSIIHGMASALPPLYTLLVCLLWYYGILLLLLGWDFVKWIMGLIRG